jgi:hypothetical protein
VVLPGHLVEVVLDPEQCPRDLLDALVGGQLGRVGVSALCTTDPSGHPDTWTSVVEKINQCPPADDMNTWVLFIDPNAIADVSDAVSVYSETTGRTTFGPLVSSVWAATVNDVMPLWPKAMGAWLWPVFQGLRDLCERTGIRVVVITTDLRPDHGRAPTLLRTHRFRDARVRSFIGDAGRYWSHLRYLVESGTRIQAHPAHTLVAPDGDQDVVRPCIAYDEHHRVVERVVCLKDEAEGQVGRVIFERRPSAHLRNQRSGT